MAEAQTPVPPDLYLAARFWAKVDVRRAGECWPWKNATNEHGYGLIRVNGGNVKAHRLALELSDGVRRMPDEKVRHRCDNPPCCNPAHLIPGTQADNIADMVERGRVARGAQKPNSKLTPADVAEMRRRRQNGETQAALASEFGVTQSRVSVLTRKAS